LLPAHPELHEALHERIRTVKMFEMAPSSQGTLPHISGESTVADAPPAPPGYRLLRKISQGGMGVVYEAEHEVLGRNAAVKFLLHHHGDTVRFMAEAKAVATARHPHVVAVHDYGHCHGRPFLAMEYLPGGTLHTRHLAQGAMDPRAAAELLAKLASAIQTTHERGIIHRDLKPDNILFDETGEPRVTDFGLAKDTGREDLTDTNAILGTPAYMAPEQAQGDHAAIGPRADVWALGAILYECLTGQRAFRGKTKLECLEHVLKQDPTPPRALNPRIPRELELIVGHCLHKNPAERYPSARALLLDLQCWLEDRPISVKPAGWAERALKWTRRNRKVASVAAVVFLVLSGATAFSVSMALKARAAEKTANEDREKKTEALARARESRERVHTIVQTITAPYGEDSLFTQSTLTDSQRQLLNELVKYFDEYEKDAGDDEPSRIKLIEAGNRTACIYYRLGELNKATALLHRTIAIAKDIHAQHPDDRSAADRVKIPLFILGFTEQRAEHYAEALAAYTECARWNEMQIAKYPEHRDYHRERIMCLMNSVGMAKKTQGTNAVEGHNKVQHAIADAMKRFPNDPELRLSQAIDLHNLAMELRATDPTRAMKVLDTARAILKDLVAKSPGNHTYRREYAAATTTAATWGTQSDELFQEAILHLKTISDERPGDSDMKFDLAEAHIKHAGFLLRTQRKPEAVTAFTTGANLHYGLARANPDVPKFQNQALLVLQTCANVQSQNGQADAALASWGQAVEVAVAQHLKDHENPAKTATLKQCYLGRAKLYEAQKKIPEAIKDYGKAITYTPKDQRAELETKRSALRAGLTVGSFLKPKEPGKP
jgi:tetratricopeptide (TPR) repeat protein